MSNIVKRVAGLKVVSITLPVQLYNAAKTHAKADNRTFSNFVKCALIKALEAKP